MTLFSPPMLANLMSGDRPVSAPLPPAADRPLPGWSLGMIDLRDELLVESGAKHDAQQEVHPRMQQGWRLRLGAIAAGLSLTLGLAGPAQAAPERTAELAQATPPPPAQPSPAPMPANLQPLLPATPAPAPAQSIPAPPSLQPLPANPAPLSPSTPSPSTPPPSTPNFSGPAVLPAPAAPLSPAPANPLPGTASFSEDYVLGPGDQIRIDIFDVPEFSGNNGQYVILSDGTLNLPWVGKISVQNLSLDQAADALEAQYARYIRNPMITVTLLSPRPLRVGIIGQVNRPGVYTVNPGGGASRHTVTLAIQAAGGITQLADLRKIEVRRPRGNGFEEVIAANLWDFLQQGDLSQDVPLRDGDTLVVPEATALNPEEAAQLAAANVSPTAININVVGEVMRPGTVSVPPNTSLNQALLAAGGFNNQRARQGSVELIRLNPNGTVDRRRVRIDFSANINPENNPALRANDIVVVGRSTLASTSDFLGSVLNPLNGLFGIFRLLGGFGLF